MEQKKKKKSYYNCSVSGCTNSTLKTKLTFFKIPPVSNRKTEWLKLIDREDLTDSACLRARVCESHFNPDYISVSSNRKLLKKNAVPQLLLPEIDNSGKKKTKKKKKVAKTDASTQCDSDFQQINQELHIPLYLLNDTDTPQKRRLLSEIQSHSRSDYVSSNTESEIDIFHNLCDKFLTKTLSNIVKQQKKIKTFGHKFNLDYKIFCLNLYYVSPQAYQLLKGTLCLPSKPTLKKMYMPVTTKIDHNLMGILKTKVQFMNDMNRNCTLVVGIMRLKTNLFYNIREDRIYGFHEVNGVQSPEPAKYALVAMVHGLLENYKQPVGFALLADPKNYPIQVSEWIDKLIIKLSSIGLQVRILVSDMRYDFLNSAKDRSVSAKSPFFMVGERKIYYVFDPSNLIKLVRNNFMKYEFHFEDNVAKWNHIIQFYEKDKLKRLRLVPKLTDSHINPTDVEKTKIRYAKEVFSATVAASLSTYRDFGVIENSGEGTIKLIGLMNDLYDFLNTSSLNGSTQYKKAFSGEDYQTSFVNSMLNFFASLELIDPNNGQNVTSKVKFIEGFQITLKSLLLLFEDLKTEGYSYIKTKRLNQDCLENFFDQIKKQNGNSTRLTSWQLVSGFRKIFFINILKSPKSGHCAEDLAKCLLNCEKLYASSIKREFELKYGCYSKKNLMPPITTTDYNTLDLPEDDAIVYVSGYLLRTCLNSHDCVQQLMDYTTGEDNSQDYSQDTTLTYILPGSFVEFITSMEERFCEFFQSNYLNCEIIKSLLTEVKGLGFEMPCKCFPLAYCKRLYMRMRIYQTLKYNNRVIRQCKDPQQSLSVTNLE